MATVSRLSVQNVRSHTVFETELSPNVSIITGGNGSGKTSLIEALYLVLRGTSFKGGDNDILKTDTPWWKIDIIFNKEEKRSVSFDPTRPSLKKQFIVDSKKSGRLAQKQKYPAVLFEPEDLRLLNGSPARRRQFIDRFISQLNPLYGATLRKYERALKQRNNLLKRFQVDNNQLFSWNIALSEHGAYLIEQRIAFIEQINQKLNDVYSEIAHTNDHISIHYSHTVVGNVSQKILAELEAHVERDKIIGSTSVGPHRHDVLFEINHSPALSTASRGEVRTIVLALKFIEVDIVETLTGLKPLILLDDVFSELDITRQKALSERTKGYQIVMTSTHVVTTAGGFKEIKL